MKRLRAFLTHRVVIALASLLVGVFGILIYPFPLSKPGVTVETAYMQYACGDCYTQFRILRAASPGEALAGRASADDYDAPYAPRRFVGWDMLVYLRGDGDTVERYFYDHYPQRDCYRPSFRLHGQFRRRLIYALIYDGDHYDGTYFDAESGVAVFQRSRGCAMAGEHPL